MISAEDLSGSVWVWHKDGGRWAVRKVITIPAEPADPEDLPPALRPFGAVPPLVSDIDLSVDDRWLYVSCWGTGELKQYDVSDIFHPRETGSVELGGIVARRPHPAAPGQPLSGGPQMVELSRDGKRVYVTNSLYGAWDPIFYPDGVRDSYRTTTAVLGSVDRPKLTCLLSMLSGLMLSGAGLIAARWPGRGWHVVAPASGDFRRRAARHREVAFSPGRLGRRWRRRIGCATLPRSSLLRWPRAHALPRRRRGRRDAARCSAPTHGGLAGRHVRQPAPRRRGCGALPDFATDAPVLHRRGGWGHRAGRLGQPARGLRRPGPQPAAAFPTGWGHGDGRRCHGVGRAPGRLSLRGSSCGVTGLAGFVERLPTEQTSVQRLSRRARRDAELLAQ